MAGSWEHITDEAGGFRGTALIDNVGDAYEALEQCYGMVQLLANALEDAGMVSSLVTRQDYIGWAAEHYEAGLDIGSRPSST